MAQRASQTPTRGERRRRRLYTTRRRRREHTGYMPPTPPWVHHAVPVPAATVVYTAYGERRGGSGLKERGGGGQRLFFSSFLLFLSLMLGFLRRVCSDVREQSTDRSDRRRVTEPGTDPAGQGETDSAQSLLLLPPGLICLLPTPS